MTLAHRLFAPIKRYLPRPLSSAIRALGTAVLTPLYFSIDTGHFRSALLGSRPVDKHGRPIPWYTYPMIDLLQAKDFTGRTVLEFGCGYSTLWWSSRAHSVLAFESDEKWYRFITARAPRNAKVVLVPENLEGADQHIAGQSFDVVVIDGLDRFKAAGIAINVVKAAGAIILDNSEGFWGPEGTYPILELFRSKGFQRVDFYGYAPGVILPHCTSVFFQGECFLFRGDENPVKKRV